MGVSVGVIEREYALGMHTLVQACKNRALGPLGAEVTDIISEPLNRVAGERTVVL